MKATTKMVSLIGLIAVIIPSLSFTTANTNFSGTWVRNTDKCTLSYGLSINSIPTAYTLKETGKKLSITRTQKYGSGESNSYIENLKLDGTSSTTKISGDNERISTIELAKDGKSFKEVSSFKNASGNTTQTRTENWTLSNDGNVLEINSDSQDEKYHDVWTGSFDKKEN